MPTDSLSPTLALACLVTMATVAAQPHGEHHHGGSTSHNQDAAVTVNVYVRHSSVSVTARHAGVTLDAGAVIRNWAPFDFRSPKVLTMARALSPSYFRLGGTSADRTTYDMHATFDPHRHHDHSGERVLAGDQWRMINEFVQKAGWDFIYDLNALKRNADGSWNPDNARELLKYSASKNYTIAGFQLGNEYNLYRNKHNTTLTASQLARDVARLRQVLDEFPQYTHSFIVGPETSGLSKDYFQAFLADGGAKVVHAASTHHYYMNGENHHTAADFTSTDTMDSLEHRLNSYLAQVHAVDRHLPLWLTETSSTTHGGIPGLSDRFVAGFLWLDKLGVCGHKGVQAVLRQSIQGGAYSLLDDDLNPRPDYWLTLLYKRIVRGAVFSTAARSDVRVYAACANTDNFPAGSVAVYMLNPNNYTVTFDLHQFHDQRRLRFSLTAGDHDGLESKYIALNGRKLQLEHDALPHLHPQSVPPGLETAPPYSYTFLVFTEASNSLCMH